jgi:hypothetical protein
MPRHLAALSLTLLAALVAACGAAPPPPPAAPKPVTLTVGDEATTLAAVGDHFKRLGWSVSPDPALRRLVLVNPKGGKFGLGAHMGAKGELNHLVMFKAFMPKAEAKGTPKIAELVAKLTNNVNGVVYQVSDDQAVVCATWVYFLDTLDPALVIRTLELLEQVAVTVMAAQVPELVKLLQ